MSGPHMSKEDRLKKAIDQLSNKTTLMNVKGAGSCGEDYNDNLFYSRALRKFPQDFKQFGEDGVAAAVMIMIDYFTNSSSIFDPKVTADAVVACFYQTLWKDPATRGSTTEGSPLMLAKKATVQPVGNMSVFSAIGSTVMRVFQSGAGFENQEMWPSSDDDASLEAKIDKLYVQATKEKRAVSKSAADAIEHIHKDVWAAGRLISHVLVASAFKSPEHAARRLMSLGTIGSSLGLQIGTLSINADLVRMGHLLKEIANYKDCLALEFCQYEYQMDKNVVPKSEHGVFVALIRTRVAFFGMGALASWLKASTQMKVTAKEFLAMIAHPSTRDTVSRLALIYYMLNKEDVVDFVTPVDAYYPFCYARALDENLCDNLSSKSNPIVTYLCSAIERLCLDAGAKPGDLEANKSFTPIPTASRHILWNWAVAVSEARGSYSLLGDPSKNTYLGKAVEAAKSSKVHRAQVVVDVSSDESPDEHEDEKKQKPPTTGNQYDGIFE